MVYAEHMLQSPAWSERPVFISSTFRDMHAERDALLKFVFPALEERLHERRERLIPIDLRWGVESVGHEYKEVLVLQVCLREVDRARPLMLVILGQRYGWVPPALQMATAVEGRGHELANALGKSVVELEIAYGALATKEPSRAAFFFRDLDAADMAQADRELYDDRAAGRLEGLSHPKPAQSATGSRPT